MSAARDEGRRLREAFGSAAGPVERGPGCPSDEEIWEAAQGGLEASRIRELLAHVASCPACVESWRAAREIGVESMGGARASMPRHAVRRRVVIGIGFAVAASLAALMLFRPTVDDPHPRGQARGVDATSIESLVDERERLPRDAAVLRWTAGPEGTLYTVEVTLEDLTEVAREEELEVAELQVPPEELADLAPGAVLLWRVEAFLPDATRVASPVFRVVIE